jgi:hypothetical protein
MLGKALRRPEALALVLASALASILFYDMCALIFDCGCTAFWAGGAELCNVHHASGPRCPWCTHPTAGATAFFGVVLAQAALIYGPLPAFLSARGIWGRFAAALVAFPAVAALVGAVHGSWYGYWG